MAVARTGKGLGYSDRRTEPIFFARTIVLTPPLGRTCASSERGKNSQYCSSLNQAHLISKSLKSGQARERERIERELRDRLIRSGVRLVVENMDGAVAHLEEVDVAGEDARGASFG